MAPGTPFAFMTTYEPIVATYCPPVKPYGPPIDVLVFLFHKSPKNYIHNKIIVLRWDGSIHVIYLLVWVDTP